MRLVDRYVTRLYGRGLLLLGAACVALYVTVDFFDKIDNLMDHPSREKFSAAGMYYLYQIPLILHSMLPAIALLAGVATVATLLRGSELATLQSAGLSTRRTLGGTFLAAGALCGLAFLNQEVILPAVAAPLEEATETMKQKPHDENEDSRFYNPIVTYDAHGWLLQVGSIDTVTGEVEHVTAIRRSGGAQTFVTARRGVYENRLGGWRLFGGRIQIIDDNRPDIARLEIPPEGHLLVSEAGPDSILKSQEETLFLPRDELHARAKEHRGIASLRVQYYHRLAAPFSPLVLLTAGLPLCLLKRTKTLAAGIFLTIVVAGLFFFCQIACAILGSQRLITAQLAAFLPSTLFLAGGGWAWTKVKT